MTTTATLPTLTGSPRQISWAEQIRTEFLATVGGVEHYNAIAEVEKLLHRDARIAPDAFTTVADAIVTQALSHTTAEWWIDNRGDRKRGIRTPANRAWSELPADQRKSLTSTAAAAIHAR